jgi:hypothetical protein
MRPNEYNEGRRGGVSPPEVIEWTPGVPQTATTVPVHPGSGPVSVPAVEPAGPPREGGAAPPEGGEGRDEGGDGTGGYDRVAAARADLKALAEGIAKARDAAAALIAEMGQLTADEAEQVQAAEQLESARQVDRALEQAMAAAGEMVDKGAGQDPGLAFASAAEMSTAGSTAKRAKKRWRGTWDSVWEHVRRLFPLLWSIIGHLVKVREWTVSGQIGGGVFGLAQAGISVTFG